MLMDSISEGISLKKFKKTQCYIINGKYIDYMYMYNLFNPIDFTSFQVLLADTLYMHNFCILHLNYQNQS